MVLVILFTLLAVVGMAYCFFDDIFMGFWDYVLGIFISALAGIAVFLFCGLICLGISSCVKDESMNIELVDSQNIIALKDSQNIDGQFYLMGGYVKEDLYYYYAKETEFGYKCDKVKASDSFVVYTDGQPKIETYKATSFKHWWMYIYAIPEHTHYSIYVPAGTVTNEYKIDLG